MTGVKERPSLTTPSSPTTTMIGRSPPGSRKACTASVGGWASCTRCGCFGTTTDMAANPDLWGKVTDAMDRSRYLIVVLSPRAAASDVGQPGGRLLAGATRAGPALDRGGRGPPALGRSHPTVRPGPVRCRVAGADRAGGTGRPNRSTSTSAATHPGTRRHRPFREKVTDLAAPIHGKSKYELASDDVREQRRFRRLRRAAIAGLVLLTILALAAAAIAFVQRQEAVPTQNGTTQSRAAT